MTIEVVVSWVFEPVFDASHRAALTGGKSLVYVSPPAWWAALPLFDQLAPSTGSRAGTIVVAPEPFIAEGTAALQGIAGAGAVHGVTGLARSARRLQTGSVDTLLASPKGLHALVARPGTSLAPTSLVLAWPELILEGAEAGTLDTLLGEFRQARRLVLTSDHTRLQEFLARHAHRAPVCTAARLPDEPVVEAVRYAVTHSRDVPIAVRAALDTLDPAAAFIWTPTREGHDWREFGNDPSVRVGSDPGDL